MSTERDPNTDQQLPVTPPVLDGEACHDGVVLDIAKRRALGVHKYGVPLHPHNGRSFLIDLYEELLDAVAYLNGLQQEQDASHHVLVIHRGDGDSETYPYEEFNDVMKRAAMLIDAGHDVSVEKITRTRIF